MSGLKHCAFDGCMSRQKDEGLSFFSLPTDEKIRKQWLEILNRPDFDKPDLKVKSYVVCSKHFDKSSIIFTSKLKSGAIPTQFPQEDKTCDQATQTTDSPINILSSKNIEKAENCSGYTQTDKKGTLCESTQTSMVLSENTPRKRKLSKSVHESQLKKRKLLYELDNIIKEVKSKKDEVTKRLDKLIGWQIRKNKHSKGNRFDTKFKLFALNLHFSSPQTYRCLKTLFNVVSLGRRRNLRLPSETTLNRFKIIIPPKFNDRVLNFLSAKLKSLPKHAKYCTISMDEMVLKRHLHYDTKRDEIIGLHNINGEVSEEIASHACVLMLRGIYVNWKQPIAYSFLASTKHYTNLETWLDEVILKLFDIGIDVRAIISDQDSNFDKYAKDIKKITAEKPYYFINGKKIYYIFDVPHLIKCVRNNLLVKDFKLDDKVISWKHVESLYSQQKEKRLKMIPRVTEKHLHPNNFQKMRVEYAAQIFSYSVYAALNILIFAKILPEDARATADFIEQMNNLFDVLNSSTVQSKYKYKKSFSFKKYQVDVLKDAIKTFKNIIAINPRNGKNNTNRIKTFKNIAISIQSILMLATDLKNESFKSLYTRRLNKDCFENFFGAIRQQGENCKDPTPIQFQRSFSKLFLCNMLKNSRYSNCQEGIICELLQKGTTFYERPNQIETKIPTSLVALNGDTDYRFVLPTENALNYVSGYLLCKCTKKHSCQTLASQLKKIPDLNTSTMFTHFRAYNKSSSFYGGLKVPPDTFNNYIRNLETTFLENFKSNLMERPGSKLYELLKGVEFNFPCPCFPKDYLLKLFIRFKIFATIRFNNRDFREGKKQIAHFIKLKHM